MGAANMTERGKVEERERETERCHVAGWDKGGQGHTLRSAGSLQQPDKARDSPTEPLEGTQPGQPLNLRFSGPQNRKIITLLSEATKAVLFVTAGLGP